MQLHGFRFICLLQPRFLTVVDNRVVTLSSITHFITTRLFLRDESEKIHIKTIDLFPTKLGQYSIILRLPWFKKHLSYIQFDKNTINFDFFHYLQHCLPSYQPMTVSGLNTLFDHGLCLTTLSNQAVNVSSTDDFAPDPCSRLLSYYRYCLSPSSYQDVNVSSIDKPTDHCSCSCSTFLCSFTFGQTSVSFNILWSYNPHFRYFYNSYHRFNMADSLKTMNQKLLQPEDWIYPPSQIHKKSSLNCRLWIFQWLAPCFSICLCSKHLMLKIWRFLVFQYAILRKP